MKPIVVRSAGGIASQLLALQNALYFRDLSEKEFQFEHYSFGTGVHYPFGINRLLFKSEIGNENVVHRGYANSESSLIGQVIENGPLQKFSFEKCYSSIRGSNFDVRLKWLIRKEWPILADPNRIIKAPKDLRIMSGGFAPVDDSNVHEELTRRFRLQGKFNPYISDIGKQVAPEIAIHYRIGDMRLKYDFPTAKGDGIISPKAFKSVLQLIPDWQDKKISVISENPDLAIMLLSEAGIKAFANKATRDIWEDLYEMCHANVLICPYSSVSVLAASIRNHKGLISFFPSANSVGIAPKWEFPKTKFYKPEYLGKQHWIYDIAANKHSRAKYLGYQKRD